MLFSCCNGLNSIYSKPLLRCLRYTHRPTDIKAFTAHVRTDHLPHSIIIDCSNSEEVAKEHAGWLEQNIHVVTANKKGLCGSMSLYNAILRQRKVKQHNYMYEVTVGGGLKIITSLQAMLIGGDR